MSRRNTEGARRTLQYSFFDGLTERQSEAAQNKASILKEIAAAQTEKNQFVARYSKYADLDELTTEIAEELVDRITIYPDGRIDIRLNYIDELKQFMGE